MFVSFVNLLKESTLGFTGFLRYFPILDFTHLCSIDYFLLSASIGFILLLFL